MSSTGGGHLIADIVSTSIPGEVAKPHGRNSFAIGDGRASEDPHAVKRLSVDVEAIAQRSSSVIDSERYPTPTPEEAATLRRVSDSIPAAAWALCFVELAERASYYGAQTVFSNFLQYPLPAGGNGAGAPPAGTEETAGALGKGEQFAVAIVLLFSFLAYVVPIFSSYFADVYTGRYKMIFYGVIVCGVAHIIMTCGAIPSVLQAGHGVAPFMISLITLAIGAGMFKPCVAPTLLDQYEHQRPYTKVLKGGEKVIVDPETTIQRIMLFFYGFINIGAFLEIATTYCEKLVGYWLAFLVPTIIYLALPILLLSINKRVKKSPPGGSDLQKVWKIAVLAFRENKGKFWVKGFWESAKPTSLQAKGITTFAGKAISWSDKDVNDVVRTVEACAIFLYFPIYTINDGGVGSVETSQAGSMTTAGAPNDLLNSFNPLTIIVFIPILSHVIYPLLRRYKIKFGPISRITFGFILAAISGVIGAIVQYEIYQTSPCGYYASDCDIGTGVSPISVWVQLPNWVLGAMSECFCNVTAYEMAYARSPKGMKSLVMALFLFNWALSSALGEVISPAIKDPYLIWIWAGPAIALAVQTVIFWFRYKHLNDEDFMTYEDESEDDSSIGDNFQVPETVTEETDEKKAA